MKGLRRIFGLILSLAMTAAFFCVPASAAAARLNVKSASIVKGDTFKLKVIDGTALAWTSADVAVATVDDKGVVTGEDIGTTYIYANVGGAYLKCTVKVSYGVLSAEQNITVEEGTSAAVTVNVNGVDDLLARSSGKDIASASWNGAKIKNGAIKLTVDGNKAGSAKITVYSKEHAKDVYFVINVTVTEPVDRNATDMEFINGVNDNMNVMRENNDISSLSLNSDLCGAAEEYAQKISIGKGDNVSLKILCSAHKFNSSVLYSFSFRVSDLDAGSVELQSLLSEDLAYVSEEYTNVGIGYVLDSSSNEYICVVILSK